MKMFVLIPPVEMAEGGSYPLVACDDAGFAEGRNDVEEYTALIYSDEDLTTISALEVGGKHYDGQGWQWWRANDVP